MLNIAPEPTLVLDCEMFVNVDVPVAVPYASCTYSRCSVPVADAVMAPETGELPDAEATVAPVKSSNATKTK